MRTFNTLITKEKRLALRKNHTDAEKALWSKLRNKQMNNYKFFRQYGVGPYIVDFYCPLLKLVIEVDGGQHYNENEILYDRQREMFLNEAGITVIRFNNLDVLKNIAGVLKLFKKNSP